MFDKLKESILGIPEGETLGEVLKENGILGTVTGIIAVSLAMFHIITSYVGQLEAFKHRVTHLLVVIVLVFLTSLEKKYRSGDGRWRMKISMGLDVLFALAGVVCLIYTFTNSEALPLRAGSPTVMDLVMGSVAILLTIEASRRHVGLGIVVISVFFLFYVYAGPWFPGFLKHAPFTFGEIINIQYLDLEGLWGSPLGAAASFVIIFLIFAGLLMETGILETFMNFTMKLVGKSVGGPAKVAVVSSGLVGMVNGTAVGNALLTGQVSIPLMKKMGYKPAFAAAVEATASTGGQVMPPIMGSAAFIIAMFLGIPYAAVCKAAVLPAILWFFSIYVIVHLEAKKLGLQKLTDEDMTKLPTWKSLFQVSYLVFPMLLLIAVLMMGYSEVKAGFWGVVSLLLVASFRAESRFTLRGFFSGLRTAVEMTFSVTTACACAGIIVGCVMQSGLGYTLSTSLINIAGGKPFILLPLVMLASLILGTGMMTVGVYIIVSVLVVPAMISMGLHTLASHLFAFYFGILCNITPPVATAAYGAAGIAEASPWETGLISFFKLALPILCVPYVFIFQPGLLLEGSLFQILFTAAATFTAVFCFDVVVSGFLFKKCSLVERILFLVAGGLLITPSIGPTMAGAALFGLGFVFQKYFGREKMPNMV